MEFTAHHVAEIPEFNPTDKLAERLAKRAEKERDIAANSAVVAELLAPQLAKFNAREGHNVYAVRMQIDHHQSAERDAAFADDLDAAATALTTLLSKLDQLTEALIDIRNRILCPVGPSPTLDEITQIASKALSQDTGESHD